MEKGIMMELGKLKSKYELSRSLNRGNYKIVKIVRGDKRELISELNKFQTNRNEYVMIILELEMGKL